MAAFEDISSPDLEQFKGGKWTDWLEAVRTSESKQQPIPDHASKRDVEVARLKRSDMSLFGYRPANDKFYLVTCEHCGHLVKPQSLNVHYERRHRSLRITKPPSTLLRLSHGHGKHQVEKTNHRLLPSAHSSKHGGHSFSHQNTSSEQMYGHATKSEGIPEKGNCGVSNDKEKRRADGSLSKNYRTEISGAKASSVTSVGKPSRNAVADEGASIQNRSHHSSNKRAINKPGGTIQLNEIPESHVVKASRSSLEGSVKHHKLHKSVGGSSFKPTEGETKASHQKLDKVVTDMSGGKSRKNHDGYHHHFHQTVRRDTASDSDPLSPDNAKLISPNAERKMLSPNRERKLSTGIPLVVLQKTSVSASSGTVKLSHSKKRTRPLSGNSDSSLSPPRSKVPTLPNNAVAGKGIVHSKTIENVPTAPPKVKKREKILPIKAREYDPNKHCGVWVKDENSHCRRSLTCKVHPLSAKRAVTGRLKPYDELVQEHGREKQRLKEKAAACASSPMPPPQSPSVQSIKSPPVPSPVEFVVPSPASKSTPLSPPTCAAASVATSRPATAAAPKAKPSITLFPRLYAAWHIDSWDNDEVVEDSAKSQNSFHCMQRHPQPLTVLNFQARRSGLCQVSYSRKLERQLEAVSSNFQKFPNRPQKTQKPFSFTPIPGATFKSASMNSIAIPNFTKQAQMADSLSSRAIAATKFAQSQRTNPHVLHVASVSQFYADRAKLNDTKLATTSAVANSVSQKLGGSNVMQRKLSSVSASVSIPSMKQNSMVDISSKSRNRSRSGHVINLLRSAASTDSTDNSQSSEVSSTSPLVILNNLSSSPSSLQSTVSGSPFQTRTLTPGQAMEGVNHVMQVDGNQLVVQLPNGLSSNSGNVLLKQGSHSVTLSGNIGALTVPNDDTNFLGNQLPKTLKNINSNNNFVVQGEGNLLVTNEMAAKSKHFTCMQQQPVNGPVVYQQNQQPGPLANSIILQNDEHLLLNQQATQHVNPVDSTSQQFSVQNTNFSDGFTRLDPQNQNLSETASSTNDLMKLLYGSADNCDTFPNNKMDKCGTAPLPNLSQIDTSIFEQVLNTSNTQQAMQNQITMDGTQSTPN